MTILISGINSGLGKYLHEELGCFGFDKNTPKEEMEEIKNHGADVIIHCAFNSQKEVNSESISVYLEDNVALTEKLVHFPHKKFIFISTVDVYPKDGGRHVEDEIINVDAIKGIYGITKIISESIVKKYCNNYLILRSSAFLGKYSRRNSLVKIAEDKECILSLSERSRFNYVLYSDVLNFIRLSVQKNLKGIFNLASSENITLLDITKIFRKQVQFGNHFYDVGNIDNKKIASILSVFKKTSKEIVTQYKNEEYE